MERALTTILLASVGAELGMLHRITHQQAGGWGDDITQTYVQLSLVAALRFFVTFGALVWRARRRVKTRVVWPFVVALAGLPFFLLALSEYGHATPGLLFLGWITQCLAVLVGLSKSWLAGTVKGRMHTERPPTAIGVQSPDTSERE